MRAAWPHQARTAPAFTLVELLVVVTIISALVSLMSTGLAGAREGARRTRCSANLRQLATATTCYVELYRDFPLHESRGVIDQFEVPADSWLCPSDRKRPEFLQGSSYNYLAYNAMFDPHNAAAHPPSTKRAYRTYQNDSHHMLYWDAFEWHKGRQAVTYDGVVREEGFFQNVTPRPAWLDPMDPYPND